MDEVVLDGKTYITSKKAAAECGYAQDYVGQLSRKGFIDAKRVSGQWYVQLDSLKVYKEKAETFKPEPPKYQPDPNVEATINIDGKEYASAARAAKIAEYNQDYIAQLARAGKVPSRQTGNRWYVEIEALLRHKEEKDAMLRAVQAEAVGLKRPVAQAPANVSMTTHKKVEVQPLMTYKQEAKPLFPEIAESVALKAVQYTASEDLPMIAGKSSKIPIRVLRPITIEAKEIGTEDPKIMTKNQPRERVALPRKTISRATYLTYAFSIALLIAVGIGTYKKDAVFSYIQGGVGHAQTASASSVGDVMASILHKILTKEIVYQR